MEIATIAYSTNTAGKIETSSFKISSGSVHWVTNFAKFSCVYLFF